MHSKVGIINIPRKLSDHDLVPQIVKKLDVEPAVRGTRPGLVQQERTA